MTSLDWLRCAVGTWPLAVLTSLDMPRRLLKPQRRLQQEGTQWKKWSMNQRNWRRKKSLKKPKKLGDESLSKMGCGTVQTIFTSFSNKVALLKINGTFKYDGRDRCRTCSAGDLFDSPRRLLKPQRRLQQEGLQWKKWSMNQRNWRRKKSLKKPKKLGDESLSKMACGIVQTIFTSFSNKVALLKINGTFQIWWAGPLQNL